MFIKHPLDARPWAEYWDKIANNTSRDPVLLEFISQNEKHMCENIRELQ